MTRHDSLYRHRRTLGRLGDLFGRKWIYILGFLVFVASSAFYGLAQTSAQLDGARVFQGIGGAIILANGRALVSINSQPSEQGKALDLTSTVTTAGLAAPSASPVGRHHDLRLERE